MWAWEHRKTIVSKHRLSTDDYILFLLVFYILQNDIVTIHIPSLDGQVRLESNTYWQTVYVVW